MRKFSKVRTSGPARISLSILPCRYRATPLAILGQAGRAGRLEKRKIVEFVIVVVNDRVPFELRMLFQPGADLIPAGSLGQIRNDIRIRDTPIAGAEQAGGVVAPIRNENRPLHVVRATSFLNVRRSFLSTI